MVTQVHTPAPRPYGPEQPVDVNASAFASLYPFASHYLDVSSRSDAHRGKGPLWLHYVDEGPRSGPVVVLLHGNPTWSFMWRDVIRALSPTVRCVAPDHIGMGLSDRPQDFSYRLEDHAANVRALVEHIGADDVILIAHDWGGMIGMSAAVEVPERFSAFVMLNTAAFTGKLPWRIRTARVPLLGKAAVLGFNGFVRAALAMCTVDKHAISDQARAGYLAPYGTPHDRLATLRFVEDVPLDADHPTWKTVDDVDGKLARLKGKPMLLVWGEQDWCFTPTFRKGWQARFPAAKVVAFSDGAHFVLEDKRVEAVAAIQAFVQDQRAARGTQ